MRTVLQKETKGLHMGRAESIKIIKKIIRMLIDDRDEEDGRGVGGGVVLQNRDGGKGHPAT
jgi:hypothetical protein